MCAATLQIHVYDILYTEQVWHMLTLYWLFKHCPTCTHTIQIRDLEIATVTVMAFELTARTPSIIIQF